MHLGCHSRLQEFVGSNIARVVCFNLGYMPRGDKAVITKPSTTIAAIEAALEVSHQQGCVHSAAAGGRWPVHSSLKLPMGGYQLIGQQTLHGHGP